MNKCLCAPPDINTPELGGAVARFSHGRIGTEYRGDQRNNDEDVEPGQQAYELYVVVQTPTALPTEARDINTTEAKNIEKHLEYIMAAVPIK